MKLRNLIARIKGRIQNLSFKSYLFYALGEILLIVVGVLIAVSINNYNDKNRKEEQLNIIFSQIATDLDSDVTNLKSKISTYEEKDSIITNVLREKYTAQYFETINEENYSECMPCYAHHIGFETFTPKLDGYNQLMNFDLNPKSKSEKLSHHILFFYKDILKEINLIEQVLAATTLKNLEDMEAFEWYANFILNKYDPDAISYFQNNQIYKNKLATFQLLAIENHLTLLKNYSEKAAKLSARLKENNKDLQ